MIVTRRKLFGFGAALVAAPAIVRVASLMPLSMPRAPLFLEVRFIDNLALPEPFILLRGYDQFGKKIEERMSVHGGTTKHSFSIGSAKLVIPSVNNAPFTWVSEVLKMARNAPIGVGLEGGFVGRDGLKPPKFLHFLKDDKTDKGIESA